jgi:methylmalonyl-CoA/ethylmalonyl-CoA epimerase
MENNIRFHHFGLAVKSFDSALKFYGNLNYNCSNPIVDELQKVELIICTSDIFPSVELIKPINEESPIINYLKKTNEIIYHTCYEIFDDHQLKFIFKQNRAICISKPKPAILFDNRLVSFYYIHNVGIIEILESDYGKL